MRETVSEIMQGVQAINRPKRLANNTVQYQDAEGCTCWRLHHTTVVKLHPDHTFTLDSGGWRTPTTKDRINTYAPVHIWQHRGEWWLCDGVPFFDGMRVDALGNPLDAPRLDTLRSNRALRQQVNKFVCLVDTLDTLPVPDLGDCLICSVPRWTDTDHLFSHISEGYLHGTLLVNAMRDKGFHDEQIRLHYAMNLRDTFKRALRRFLIRSLHLGA